MKETLRAPAETYRISMLASALGRYAVRDLDPDTARQTGQMLDESLEAIISYDVPPVPHNNNVLLQEAADFDSKLLRQINAGPARDHLTSVQRKTSLGILEKHKDFCTRSRGARSWEKFVEFEDVADVYGLPDLWSSPSDLIEDEIEKWGRQTQHPTIVESLSRPVALEETQKLLSLMWREVVGIDYDPAVKTYLTRNEDIHHLYWAPVSRGIDYATPEGYDRATQLSFDLPHNAAHLVHLDLMGWGEGAARYKDDMAARAYFEAVAVLSEYKMLSRVKDNPDFAREIADIFKIQETDSIDRLAQWMVADRSYEFKLRAARFASDFFMIQGASSSDIVSVLGEKFGMTTSDADKEMRKYAAWTGLGSVYSFGYRELLAKGVKSVKEAIVAPSGKVMSSWDDFRDENPS